MESTGRVRALVALLVLAVCVLAPSASASGLGGGRSRHLARAFRSALREAEPVRFRARVALCVLLTRRAPQAMELLRRKRAAGAAVSARDVSRVLGESLLEVGYREWQFTEKYNIRTGLSEEKSCLADHEKAMACMVHPVGKGGKKKR